MSHIQETWMFVVGAILIIFTIINGASNYSDEKFAIKRQEYYSFAEKHFPTMGINEVQVIGHYIKGCDDKLGEYRRVLDSVINKFPDICDKDQHNLAVEVFRGTDLDSIVSDGSTIRTTIRGEEKFLTSDGYWRSVGLRDPNKTAYQKELDEIKSRYPLLVISDNNLKRICSLMYFNWELLYIAKDEDEYSVQLRRRDESMNWTFTESTKKN